ncbi:MAG: glycine betaine ABC transporter substrate-binding protein [Streptosporangiales bacterium]
MFSRFRRLRLIAPLVAIAALAAACGGGGLGGGPSEGSLAKNAKSLDGVSLAVGGKEFTEQLVLCHITILALESAGADVDEQCGLKGSNSTRRALTSGEIDMYWEYTGTAWISYLGHTKPIPDARKQYEAVAKEDLQKNNIKWLKMSQLNDTYAIMAAKETAKKYGVSTLSDYAKLVHDNPSAASLCVASEFANRNDGLPGVEKAYGFHVAKKNLALLQEGSIYKAVDKTNPCNFGEANASTDGRIPALGLTLLKDNKHFFPQYNAAVSARASTLKKNPQIADVLNPIAAAMTATVAQKLNAKVDVDGKDPDDVAEAWLQKKGFIGK